MGSRLSAAILSIEMYNVLAHGQGQAFMVTEQQPAHLPQRQLQQQTQNEQRPSHLSSVQGTAAGNSAASDAFDNVSMTSCALLGIAAVAAAGSLGFTRKSRTANWTASGKGKKVSTLALHAFESELGVQDPVGFFDPLGFTSDGSAENFKRRRQTELKHGRISMLATMGYITPEITGKFPGYLSPSAGLKFADIPNGLGAISKVPPLGWAQIVAYGGFCELSQDQSPGTPAAEGDFGFKVLTSSDPEEKKKKLAAELANGRLAMMAIIGMFFQDGLTGSAWGDWSLYTASPLRAFESELGVQPPVGFWDPLGPASDGDVDTFRRRRAVELKHGRIAMLACIGYIVPEYFKFPGYVSPSAELQFVDVPNGLGALSKVPPEGWLQIGLFLGHYEGFFFQQKADRAPGDFEGYGFLGIGRNFLFNFPEPELDEEAREKKLAAELANGRLAMAAIIGMFYQDGLTGSAWGDWSLYSSSPLR